MPSFARHAAHPARRRLDGAVVSYGAVPVLYGFLFLAEEPTATKVLGVLCSAAAAALSSTSRTVPWDRFVERYSEVDPDATPAAASARSNTHA